MHARIRCRHEHHEADDANRHGCNVAVTSHLGLVGDETDSDGQGGGHSVGRYTEELSPSADVSHAAQDGGQEERKGIERDQAAHVDNHVSVRLPVLEGLVDVAAVKVLGGATLAVHNQAALDANAVVGAEEAGSLGPVKHKPPAEDADENGSDTLDDENPCPARSATNAVHLCDSGGKETTKGASQGSSREEDCGAHTNLGALVPAGEVVVDTGEEASFCDSEEPTSSQETREVVAKTHEGHDDAPHEYDAGEEDARGHALEESVGDRLEQGIADEEDGQGEVVVRSVCLHAKITLKSSQSRIANVCSVEK